MAGFEGGCLCGAVRYTSSVDAQVVGHCYCVDCRKTSGTGHCTHVGVPTDALTVTGEVRFFDKPADSGNMVSRGFCPTCGSAICSTNTGMQGLTFVRASSLDDPDAIEPGVNVYTSRAPGWDRPDPSLRSFREMPQGGGEAEVKAQA